MNEVPEEILQQIGAIAKNIEANIHNILNTTKPITDKHITEYEGKWNISDQYLKIYEEVGEAQKALVRNLGSENEEHMDILFSLITLFHFRNKSREENETAIYNCLLKFHRRGWLL